MLNAGDVEDGSRVGVGVLSWRMEFYVLYRTTLSNFFYVLSPTPTFNSNFTRQPIVQHRHVLFAAVPELNHVDLGRLAYRDKTLRLLRIVREHMRKVEHPETGILAGNVEVCEIVYRCRRRQRIPRAHAPVCRTYDEAVEFVSMTTNPERQHKKMPHHRKHWPPCPRWRIQS